MKDRSQEFQTKPTSLQSQISSHHTLPGMSPERPFPFLSLPPELRTQIYRYCTALQNDEEDAPNPDDTSNYYTGLFAGLLSAYERARKTSFNMHLYHPLLSSCRTIRAEAMPIFDNHVSPFPTIGLLYVYLRSIGPVRRSQLRQPAFVYHLTSNHEKWVDKLAVLELTSKCFCLIARGCPKLQILRVYMSMHYLAYYSTTHCFGNCKEDDLRVYAYYRYFNVQDVQGLHELRALRGIDKVYFEPAIGAMEFGEEIQSMLDSFAHEMMKPR